MKLAVALLALLASASSFAQQTPERPPNPMGDRMQQRQGYGQEYLARAKTMEAKTSQDRIRVLQTGAACTQAATTPQAFKACKEAERDGMKAIQNVAKPQREAMQAEIKSKREEFKANRAQRQQPAQ